MVKTSDASDVNSILAEYGTWVVAEGGLHV